MNPEDVNQNNLTTLTPVKKQIKGRIDITVPFRFQKQTELGETREEKALIKFEGIMKVFERDGIFSLGITIPEERKQIEHLEKKNQQKVGK